MENKTAGIWGGGFSKLQDVNLSPGKANKLKRDLTRLCITDFPSKVLPDDKAFVTNFTSCQVNQYTVPEARAEHLWAIGCPFGTTVSEQGVGFRCIRKVAEVNIKLLPNLQGYHHVQPHSSAHV